MADTEAYDARAALQAFFAAVQPRTPQGSTTPMSQSGFGESVALVQRLKSDMKRALQPQAVLQERKDIEGRFEKLLEQVSPAVKFKPAARPSRSKSSVDIAIQTGAMMNPPREDIPEPPTLPVVPDPDAGKPRQRCCIIVETTENADHLRELVAEERKRLFQLDTQTTAFTRELKNLRSKTWEHRKAWCHKERQIEEHFALNRHKLHTNGSTLDEQVEKENLAKKREELVQAKGEAKRWAKQARRLDAELAQHRGGGDVQRILLRHPAGEVFLPPMGSGGDSDDGSDEDDDRRAVALASDSDEEEEFRGGGGGGRPLGGGGEPPPPPSPQWRNTNRDEESDDDTPVASEASSMTSPSGESGGRPSPTGDARSRLAASLSVQKAAVESDSSDDDQANVKSQTIVPPLPGLSGPEGATTVATAAPKLTASNIRSALEVDDAEEVSSEEIYSQDDNDETSQSV